MERLTVRGRPPASVAGDRCYGYPSRRPLQTAGGPPPGPVPGGSAGWACGVARNFPGRLPSARCPRPRWRGPRTNGIKQQPGEDMGEPTAVVGRGEPAEFVHQVWPAHARQLAPMRTEVRRWLAPLVLPGDAEDDVVLAVDEAASNCVDHAYAAANADGTVELTFGPSPDASASRSWITACGGLPRTSRLAAAAESTS